MKLEILLAYLEGFSCIATGIVAIYILLLLGNGIERTLCYSEQGKTENNNRAKWIISKWPFFVIALLIAITPSIKDIWRIRIGLIKLELSSPENLSKASSEIERIGHELECKYLGCKEQKK